MSFRAIESLRFQIIEFLIFWGIGFWWGGGVQKKLPAQSLREKRKITLTNFLVRNCGSLQFHKFKLNVIACFTMKKHINHNAKLIHT